MRAWHPRGGLKTQEGSGSGLASRLTQLTSAPFRLEHHCRAQMLPEGVSARIMKEARTQQTEVEAERDPLTSAGRCPPLPQSYDRGLLRLIS